jgi:hypothetical protein
MSFFLLIIFLNYQLGQQLDQQFFPSDNYFYPALIGVGLWLIYIYFVGKYFKYNSEGNLVSFINKGVTLSKFEGRTKIHEIKKDKIKSYRITNLIIYRRLYNVYSIKNSIKDIHTNISLLSPRKTRYLKLSLDKIIAKNQTNL